MIILKLLAGVLLGGGAGFLYQKYVGCGPGGCPLTSSPVITTAYGATMGILIALM